MSLLTLGKTLVNLNYTASKDSLQAAVKQADIQTIYTSSQFLIKLKARGIDAADIFAGTRLIYLEDVKQEISSLQLLSTLLGCIFLPTKLLQYCYLTKVKHEDTAAILFSSGSEGVPKGIELSHRNLNVNTRQIADMLNTQSDDVMLSNLPIFHAFGLVATTLMPLREGIPMVCHPDPTDVVNIAKGIARYRATLLIGTSTFFRLYTLNRKVHPVMLDSLRLTIAGAEKLRTDVRDAFALKFNKTIYEGYGATETSPAVSVNIPDLLDHHDLSIQTCQKKGSVGLPFSGTCLRIVDPESLESLAIGEDGLILIGGQQVMKGYLSAPEKTAAVISIIDGIRWYHTGDKGHLNTQGFLTIVDRYSRFAKVGGEMISLTAVEEKIRAALSQNELNVLALAVADQKKGEKIVLLVTEDLSLQQLRNALINAKVSPLMYPTQCILVDEIPTLGTGKTDFSAAKRLLALKYAH
jgi:acyl-[acyl-carrier-protein]-phospholipid O-acyltransferase/long-chain-fatty-acid--[acyl-carrier-protein] ligase